MEPVILANSKFSIDLLKKLCEKNTDDVFFSPLSISSALGLVALGAKHGTETYDQIFKTLHFGRMIIMYHDLYEALNKGGNQRNLYLANRMYGDRTVNFYDDYLDKCEEWCVASLRNVDFKTDPEDARKKINDWVEKKTKGQIKSMVDEKDVTKETILALISAVYFKDKWETAFILSNKKDNALQEYMELTNTFNLGEIPEADSRILELPYQNKDLSMIVMLPNQKDGLPKLVDQISYESIFKWTEPDNMLPTEVGVLMPKFKIQETYDLKTPLEDLGMIDVFDDKCDLSGIAPGPLKLCKVLHKISVEVDETGSEVIGVPVGPLGLKNVALTKPFKADHPFVFFIRHNPTKSILFWGRYSPPAQ